MARIIAKGKESLIGLTSVSAISLICSFGYPLEELEVFKQPVEGGFGRIYDRVFVITQSDTTYPYGFIQNKAVKVSQIYQAYSLQKWTLLLITLAASASGWYIGLRVVPTAEIDEEVKEIEYLGKKEILIDHTKHALALASKAQRMQFVREMRALMDEEGSTVEEEILQADEAIEDKFVQASYLEMEGYPVEIVVSQIWGFEQGTKEHQQMKQTYLSWKNDEDTDISDCSDDTKGNVDFRSVFPEQMDSTVWKAVLSALQGGATKDSILRDVLNCSDSNLKEGEAYLTHLKEKFGI